MSTPNPTSVRSQSSPTAYKLPSTSYPTRSSPEATCLSSSPGEATPESSSSHHIADSQRTLQPARRTGPTGIMQGQGSFQDAAGSERDENASNVIQQLALMLRQQGWSAEDAVIHLRNEMNLSSTLTPSPSLQEAEGDSPTPKPPASLEGNGVPTQHPFFLPSSLTTESSPESQPGSSGGVAIRPTSSPRPVPITAATEATEGENRLSLRYSGPSLDRISEHFETSENGHFQAASSNHGKSLSSAGFHSLHSRTKSLPLNTSQSRQEFLSRWPLGQNWNRASSNEKLDSLLGKFHKAFSNYSAGDNNAEVAEGNKRDQQSREYLIPEALSNLSLKEPAPVETTGVREFVPSIQSRGLALPTQLATSVRSAGISGRSFSLSASQGIPIPASTEQQEQERQDHPQQISVHGRPHQHVPTVSPTQVFRPMQAVLEPDARSQHLVQLQAQQHQLQSDQHHIQALNQATTATLANNQLHINPAAVNSTTVISTANQDSQSTAFTAPAKFSNRYFGMHNQTNASADHLSNDQNCALWLRNLPPDITYKELLGSIRHIGRIWCTFINLPDFITHSTAAAKVVFFTPDSATTFLRHVEAANPSIRGFPIKADHNRIKYSENSLGRGSVSRCLIVTGAADFVNEESLRAWFADMFVYQTDEVLELVRADGRAVVEFRFGSYRCQAQMGKMALDRNRPAGFEWAEFGDDPCEKGETLSSYRIATQRIQGIGP